MRAVLDRVLCALGIDALFRRRHRRDLTIFMYHGVVPDALEPFCWHQLPRHDFARQMAWIKEHYTVLPLEDALTRLSDGTLPERSAAITFDDGFKNNQGIAWPVLRSLDLPVTIFLPTDAIGGGDVLWPDRVYLAIAASTEPAVDLGFLGLGTLPLGTEAERALAISQVLRVLKATPTTERALRERELDQALGAPEIDPGAFELLSWDDVTALAEDPRVSFGAHTKTHPILSQCDDETVYREVLESQQAVADRVGRAPAVFAYPNGRAVDFDDRAKSAVDAAGIRFALSTESGFAGPDDDPLALPRVCVGSDLTFDRFRLVAAGLSR